MTWPCACAKRGVWFPSFGLCTKLAPGDYLMQPQDSTPFACFGKGPQHRRLGVHTHLQSSHVRIWRKGLMRLVLDDASCFSSCPKTVSTADPWPPPRQPRTHRRAPPQRSYMSPSVRDSAGASCRHGPEDDSPRETKCNTPFYMSSVIVVMASVSGWRAWMFTDRAGWSSPCITTSDQLIASFRGEKS